MSFLSLYILSLVALSGDCLEARVKANSRAVDDAIENSLPRFKHRSLKPAQCDAIRAVR